MQIEIKINIQPFGRYCNTKNGLMFLWYDGFGYCFLFQKQLNSVFIGDLSIKASYCCR